MSLPHYDTLAALVTECEKYPADQRCGDRYTVGPQKAEYQLESWTADGPEFRCVSPDTHDTAQAPSDPRPARPDHRSLQPARAMTLPVNSKERKDTPIARGVLFYFPAALAAVARVSKIGSAKHSPGQPMCHARGRSMDHEDCIVRHMIDMADPAGGGYDIVLDEETGEELYRMPYVALVAWRALALCQEWLEKHEGAPLAPNARLPEDSPC